MPPSMAARCMPRFRPVRPRQESKAISRSHSTVWKVGISTALWYKYSRGCLCVLRVGIAPLEEIPHHYLGRTTACFLEVDETGKMVECQFRKCQRKLASTICNVTAARQGTWALTKCIPRLSSTQMLNVSDGDTDVSFSWRRRRKSR